jgi:hypothetical protein
MRTPKILPLAAAICALSGAAQAASLTVNFDFNRLFALPGQTVTARATITNIDTAIVDINGCSLTLPGAFTTDDCAIFLSGTGAPLFLNIGESATVDLFTFTPDLNFPGPAGPQPAGNFTILGTLEVSGYDGETQNLLADAAFQPVVIPEPSSLLLIGLALPVLYRVRRSRRPHPYLQGDATTTTRSRPA